MTLDQGLAFAVVISLMVLFVWGPLRYDLVALLGLLTSVVLGIVPAKEAFRGFSDDIVIIIASALVVSAAVARSGVIQVALRSLGPWLTTTRLQVIALSGSVAVLSAFVKKHRSAGDAHSRGLPAGAPDQLFCFPSIAALGIAALALPLGARSRTTN